MSLLLLFKDNGGAPPPPDLIPHSFFMAMISIDVMENDQHTNLLVDVFEHHFGINL